VIRDGSLRNKQIVAELDALGNLGGDLTRLDTLCTPDMVNHALASTGSSGLEGTCRFLERAAREVHRARWLSSYVVAENDMVVQFGEREHHWPGGAFRGFDVSAGCVPPRHRVRLSARGRPRRGKVGDPG
jgi:hypothetical protein